MFYEIINATFSKQLNATHHCKDFRLLNEDSYTNAGVHSADIDIPVNDLDYQNCKVSKVENMSGSMFAPLNCNNCIRIWVNNQYTITSNKHHLTNACDLKLIIPVIDLNSDRIVQMTSTLTRKKKTCKSFMMLDMKFCVTMTIEK